MDKNLLQALVASMRQAQAIAKGRTMASRRIKINQPDAKAVREQTGPSQSDVAKLA